MNNETIAKDCGPVPRLWATDIEYKVWDAPLLTTFPSVARVVCQADFQWDDGNEEQKIYCTSRGSWFIPAFLLNHSCILIKYSDDGSFPLLWFLLPILENNFQFRFNIWISNKNVKGINFDRSKCKFFLLQVHQLKWTQSKHQKQLNIQQPTKKRRIQ